jgi:hypothetical protein
MLSADSSRTGIDYVSFVLTTFLLRIEAIRRRVFFLRLFD